MELLKRFIILLIAAFIIFGIKWLLSDDCDWCGDALVGDTIYTIEDTDEEICESCYRHNTWRFEK